GHRFVGGEDQAHGPQRVGAVGRERLTALQTLQEVRLRADEALQQRLRPNLDWQDLAGAVDREPLEASVVTGPQRSLIALEPGVEQAPVGPAVATGTGPA